jgi:hypothetical protein
MLEAFFLHEFNKIYGAKNELHNKLAIHFFEVLVVEAVLESVLGKNSGCRFEVRIEEVEV